MYRENDIDIYYYYKVRGENYYYNYTYKYLYRHLHNNDYNAKRKGDKYHTPTIEHLVMTAKTTAQNSEKLQYRKNEEIARQPMYTSENTKITYWIIPRNRKSGMKLSQATMGKKVKSHL